jgi:hypothetical protein
MSTSPEIDAIDAGEEAIAERIAADQELQRISMINALVSVWIAVAAALFAVNSFSDGKVSEMEETCYAQMGVMLKSGEGGDRTCLIQSSERIPS